jgi:ribosomal-protein-alanine N-acetyltransferase
MIKYINNDGSLEIELGLNKNLKSISAELKEALEGSILPNLADPANNYLFFTLWTLIDKENKMMVGDICFVGKPNSQGEVEIGYGTYEAFRGQGFMTEAVGGLIGWSKQQVNIKSIIASTDQSNIASYSILENNKFVKSGQTEALFNWSLKIK